MELLLLAPEIPHNTGCAARLAAALGLRLHLVEPLGFSLDDHYLKRAGLDYWPLVDIAVHRSWESAVAHFAREGDVGGRLRLFTARGGPSLFDTDFAPDDVLVFGCESRGLPDSLLRAHPGRRVRIPIRPAVRSLNLANAVCLAAYTAMVRAGLPLPDVDGTYEPHPRAAEDVRPSSRAVRIDA